MLPMDARPISSAPPQRRMISRVLPQTIDKQQRGTLRRPQIACHVSGGKISVLLRAVRDPLAHVCWQTTMLLNSKCGSSTQTITRLNSCWLVNCSSRCRYLDTTTTITPAVTSHPSVLLLITRTRKLSKHEREILAWESQNTGVGSNKS